MTVLTEHTWSRYTAVVIAHWLQALGIDYDNVTECRCDPESQMQLLLHSVAGIELSEENAFVLRLRCANINEAIEHHRREHHSELWSLFMGSLDHQSVAELEFDVSSGSSSPAESGDA